MNLSAIILTFNSERTIAATIRSAMTVSSDIHIVDSFSSDGTRDIARQFGIAVITHPFVNYAAQRNWAIEHLPLRGEWELHLDADERLSDDLVSALQHLSPNANQVAGYHIARLVRFMGRAIRHGGMFPIWHMRCFRRGAARCETREYDQHFVVDGITCKLPGYLIDDMRMPLGEWVERHNRWSDAEVRELHRGYAPRRLIQPRLFGNPLERKRSLRKIYERSPLFARALMLFLYRYFLRLGFLDGREGLIFFALQTFWFRFLVDAKLFEQHLSQQGQSADNADAADLTSALPGLESDVQR